jgi:hypothetical protein
MAAMAPSDPADRAPDSPERPSERIPGEAGGPPSSDAWGSRKALEVLALAFVFPATLVVGFLAGRWVGTELGNPQAGIVVGLIFGAAAAFWQLRVYVKRISPR